MVDFDELQQAAIRAAARLIGAMDGLQPAAPVSAALLKAMLLVALASLGASAHADKALFQPLPTQFIAALGAPDARSGEGAEAWGIWRVDPGPRGVWLRDLAVLTDGDGVAPAGWRFDAADWWLEENGLIMEPPDFPLPPGKYLVTGAREVTAVLTVHAALPGGTRRWALSDGATLHDVTHMPCRSARYTRPAGGASCSPARASRDAFPVAPGAVMPSIAGCEKQDYAVLFIIGVPATD